MIDEKMRRRLCLKGDKAEIAPKEEGRDTRVEKTKNH